MKFNLTSVNNLSAELLNDIALGTRNFLTAFATSENFTASIISVFGERIKCGKNTKLTPTVVKRQLWETSSS